MRYRALAETGLRASVIGFGAWGIGGPTAGRTSYGPTDDHRSLATLARAFDLGITFYDTSSAYGDGHSEELIGAAFQRSRDKIIIASKVGFISFSQPQDFSVGAIRRSLEQSLRRLRTDYLDLYQLHTPPMETLERSPEILKTLALLELEGKIRAFGVSVRSPEDGLVAIDRFGVKVLQVNFNLIDQRALDSGLFERAREQRVGIIARTPFNFGFLTGKYANLQFDSRDHRSGWPREQLERWAEAAVLFAKLNTGSTRTLAQLALQFCLAPESVATVIPGMLDPEEVVENVGAAQLQPLSPDEIATIRAIYQEHEFFIGRRQLEAGNGASTSCC